MADDSQLLRGISWREAFPFTHLFRSFRIAIHPSKLVLGLAALIILHLGGLFLDAIWPVQHRVVQDEVGLYYNARRTNSDNFAFERAASRKAIEDRYADLLIDSKLETDRTAALTAARKADRLGDLKKKIIEERDRQVNLAREQRDAAKKAIVADETTKATRDDQLAARDVTYRNTVRSVHREAQNTYVSASKIKNSGIFSEFFSYQRFQFNRVIDAVQQLNVHDGYYAILNFLTVAPLWMLTQHPVYFFLFLVLFISIWAIFGGAIARIAAVHVARDEKLSIRAALRFSTGKFLSFLFAPIIPLLIVAVLGIVIMLGALVINIPWLGPILAGVFFFLALAIGFVMTLVLVGTIGGFNLMYPTIAVEGSDSFDAISRSFSYLYARPWRLAFYTAVAIIYGAITYTFLKLFITLMLSLIHTFVGFGVFRDADNTRSLWDMLWPGPGEMGRLSYDLQTMTLGSGETIGAYLIAFWVYLVIAILGAFAISFYFSANTIIYYLMRNEVDATDMDDVFVEQQDDDLMDPTPAPATLTATAPVAMTEPAPSTPPPTDPAPPPPSDTPPAT